MAAISPPRMAAASMPCAALARSPASPPGPATSPCSIPPSSTDSRAIDVTATITDVRATCQDIGQRRRFDRHLHRRRRCAATPGPARQVVLPYFDVALRGGAEIAAKQRRPGRAQLRGRRAPRLDPRPGDRPGQPRGGDPAGQRARDPARGRARPGEAEAAIDPMADPGVAKAVANATFEHLVGFELTQDQLKYNATR